MDIPQSEFFHNRRDAAVQLISHLEPYREKNPVILGIPRGGMPMAGLIARALGAEMDPVFIKKIGAPWNPELAIGAVGESGTYHINRSLVEELGIRSRYIEQARREAIFKNRSRARSYRKIKPRVPLEDRTVILVDDGIATGATMRACLEIIHGEEPKKIVLAIPVAAADSLESLRPRADEVICLHEIKGFFGGEFSQTTDQEVLEILKEFSENEG